MVNFYVYEHIRKDTAQVFYVGKGCGDRCYSKTGRNKQWVHIANSAGFYVRKVVEMVDEEMAFLVEVERIDQLRLLGIRLCNKTNGGEGCSGAKRSQETLAKMSAWQVGRILPEETRRKISAARKKRVGIDKRTDETRKKISLSMQGAKNPMFGKKISADVRAKLSAAGIGRKHSPEFGKKISARQTGDKNHMFGKHCTDEHKEKIRKALTGVPMPQKITTCPHCGKVGGANAMARYHFAKCKLLVNRVAGSH